MDLSFREKSIAGSLIITVGLFGYYFIKVFEVLVERSSERLQELPALLLGIVIAVVVVEIAYQAAIALNSGNADETDERDSLIAARSTRVAYFVLAAGSVTTIGHATLAGVFAERVGDTVMASPIMTANFVLVSFILAEITGFAMQLFYYRRGI